MSSTDSSIGILSWDFNPPKGGMGRAMQWMRNALSQGGHTVSVGDRIVPALFRRGGHLMFSMLLPFVLGSWIRTQKIRFLIVPSGPGGVFLLLRPRARIISIAYHTYAQQSRLVPGQWWKRLFIPFERRTFHMADAVLCFCEDTRRVLISDYGMNEQRIRLLPHAVDAELPVGVSKQSGLCVCVARCEARKGINVLLRAWPRVIAQIPTARCVIVGDGILAPNIDHEIARLGPSVSRIPSLERAALLSLVASADLAISPAYLEGFGLAAAEAMSLGTTVIAGKTDGLQSLIQDNETGVLFSAGDAGALALQIIRALRDEALRNRLSRNAASAARAFSREHADVHFVGAIREIVATAS